MADPPVQAQPTPPTPTPPPLPVTPDPAVKRNRARIIIGALVTFAVTVAGAYNVDICAKAQSLGFHPAFCQASK